MTPRHHGALPSFRTTTRWPKGPLLRTRRCLAPPSLGIDDVHCRQTRAAAPASSEVAGVRPARTDPDDRLRRIVLWIFALGHGRHRYADHRQPLAMAAGGHLDAVRLCDLHRRRRRHPAQRSSLSDGGLRGDAWHAAADRRDPDPRRGAGGGGGSDLLRLHQLSPGFWQFPAAVEHADRLALCRDPAVRRADRAVHCRAARQRNPQRL